MQEVKITMLGASRVGKTSLLAAMCMEFDTVMKGTELQINFADSAELQDQLAALKEVANQEEEFESTSEVGPKSTVRALELNQLVRTFTFGIGQRDKGASLQLEFADYPGEYMFGSADTAERQAVQTLVRDCAAVVITIDAPALMAMGGRYNDKFNRPDQIKYMFQDAYRELKEPRLVLLAPVKCEKYVRTKKSAHQLRKAGLGRRWTLSAPWFRNSCTTRAFQPRKQSSQSGALIIAVSVRSEPA